LFDVDCRGRDADFLLQPLSSFCVVGQHLVLRAAELPVAETVEGAEPAGLLEVAGLAPQQVRGPAGGLRPGRPGETEEPDVFGAIPLSDDLRQDLHESRRLAAAGAANNEREIRHEITYFYSGKFPEVFRELF